jgi:hypothetical protein
MKMDAMAIWSTEWAPRLFVEATKFWFYSISFSITLSLVLIYSNLSKSIFAWKKERRRSDKELKGEINSQAQRSALQWGLVKKLVVDGCDLFIPGFTTGWLVVSSGTVGILGVISTILGSLDIWERVQRSSSL